MLHRFKSGIISDYTIILFLFWWVFVEPYESLNGRKLWWTGNNIIRNHLLCSRDCHAKERASFCNCFQPFDDDYSSHHGCFHPRRKNIPWRVSTLAHSQFHIQSQRNISFTRFRLTAYNLVLTELLHFIINQKLCIYFMKVETSQS